MKPRIDISALLVLAFCVGLSSSIFLMPFWVKPFLAAAGTKNPADWIGFAGNFAAGIMTLIAAIVAWFAVQGQIKAQEQAEERASERLSERRETEQAGAKDAAKIVLTHTIHAAAAYAPELNPLENVWEYLRGNKLAITVFESYDDIVDKSCTAWRFFADDPERVASITSRTWATVIP
jgi:hypothetical protein